MTPEEQSSAVAALISGEAPYPRCEAILGPAGSGKSTKLRERSADEPNYCKLCATTGIAAVNLGPGVSTVNSVLGFYNEETAWDALHSGRFAERFYDLASQGYRNLVIDELSMMPAGTLTAITLGAMQGGDRVQRMNARNGTNYVPVGVILTGDFLQLSPVNAPYAFTSPVWPAYAAGITKLDTIYRQTDPAFLEALQAARAGRGTTAVMKLNQCGVKFVGERNDFFDGTSIVPMNDMANKINATRYEAIDGLEASFISARWGKESGEWKDIPQDLRLKVGALVMVLANEPKTYTYVNGDQGVIVQMSDTTVTVEIERPGGVKCTKDIPFVLRETVQKEKPAAAAEWTGGQPEDLPEGAGRNKALAQFFYTYDAYVETAVKNHLPYWSVNKCKWVVGWIQYMPIRLAYASTVHKTQGLTMARIQIDARSRFAGNPGMMYVALSRCRSPENIRIVAQPGDFAKRIQTATECLKWV